MPTPSPTNSNHSIGMATPSPNAANGYNMQNHNAPVSVQQNYNNMMQNSMNSKSYTQMMPQNTQRLTHSTPPSVGVPCVRQQRQRSMVGGNQPANHTSCSLTKLQELTNDIHMMPHENNMTPPPNLTPPPNHMMHQNQMSHHPQQQQQQHQHHNMQSPPPPQSQRSHTPHAPQQNPMTGPAYTNNRYHAGQQPRSGRSAQKNPNVTVNPNMPPFAPNVTIQPGTNMITGYMMNGYRMQQPMINTGFMNTNPGFMNQGHITMPMQMGMMNMHPAAQANFQPQMGPGPQGHNNPMYHGYSYYGSGLRQPAQFMNGMVPR
jgi:hypothetical protein